MYNVHGMNFEEAWEVILNTDHGIEPFGRLPKLHIWQDINESKEFYNRAKKYFADASKPIKNIMEIGSYIGGHIALMSTLINVDDGMAIVLEPEIHNRFQRRAVTEIIKPVKLVHIPLYSQDEVAVRLVLDLVYHYGSVDVFIIDGSHSDEDTIADFNNYYDMVSSPGIIMFHDITNTGVAAVFDKLADRYRSEKIELSGEVAVFGIGMVYK